MNLNDNLRKLHTNINTMTASFFTAHTVITVFVISLCFYTNIIQYLHIIIFGDTDFLLQDWEQQHATHFQQVLYFKRRAIISNKLCEPMAYVSMSHLFLHHLMVVCHLQLNWELIQGYLDQSSMILLIVRLNNKQ